MKKTRKALAFVSVGILATVTIFLGVFFNSRTSDAAVVGWSAGYIISDSVFTNKSTMNTSTIQAFLNNKVPSCDTWGTKPSEFGGGTRRQWAEAHGYSAPFICLRNYSQGGKSAAQIIYEAAQKYAINPQVLLVLLQKEQGLVTDEWPLSIQYRSATGYGCPDNAACNTDYYGFTNQVNWAAKMFRAIMNDSPTWFTPYEVGNNYIQYSPTSSCGGSNVNILNRATQALYNYTPYQPNKASLDAGWGTAPCGSYGNRNFYLYFTNWFGSIKQPPTYKWSVVSQGLYTDSARTQKLPYTATLEPGQKVYVRLIAKNVGNQTWFNINTRLGTSSPIGRSSDFHTSDWPTVTRAAAMAETEVKPGGTATFDTTFQAPQKTAFFKEYFRLVADGTTWMNDLGMYFPINVSPARQTSIYSDPSRTNLVGNNSFTAYFGEKYYGTVTIRNDTGATIPAGTRLATTNPNDRTSNFHDSSWISSNRVASLASDIAPGATGTISFVLQAPATPSTSTESFGLVIDGAGGRWIETDTSSMTINVMERPPSQLTGGSALQTNDQLLSSNDTYRLVLQSDGNLVLRHGNRAIWASTTARSGSNRLVLQSDGNLVLRSSNRAVWASNTARTGADRLILQSDGNLVLRNGNRAVWSSGTAGR